MINAKSHLQTQTRARTQARTQPQPDLNKCAFVAALVSAVLMFAIGLSFDQAIGPALTWLGR
jgi:hypothetical protein